MGTLGAPSATTMRGGRWAVPPVTTERALRPAEARKNARGETGRGERLGKPVDVWARTGSAPQKATSTGRGRCSRCRRVLWRCTVEGEIRVPHHRCRTGGHSPGNRLQPYQWPMKERQRRHRHGRKPGVERLKDAADEPHVVVGRQPAHTNYLRRGAERLLDQAGVVAQVGVAEHDALGVPVEPDVYWTRAGARASSTGSAGRTAGSGSAASVATQQSPASSGAATVSDCAASRNAETVSATRAPQSATTARSRGRLRP